MPRKKHFNIAIVGPDGSGKTSVVNHLSTKIDSEVVYCGKKEFHYKKLMFFNKLIQLIPTFLFPLKIYLRYIYYILEYFDVEKRINKTNSNKIFERYYVDRIIRYNELLLLNKYNSVRTITFLIEIPLAYLMNKLYVKKLKKDSTPIVLLNVESNVLYSRSSGEYLNERIAEIKMDSYLKYTSYFDQIIRVQSETKLENMVNEIYDKWYSN